MSVRRAGSWPEVPLRSVCEVGAGNPAPDEQHLSDDGDVPFVRMQDVDRNSEVFLAETVDRIAATTAESLRLKLWPRGALLAPKSGASVLLDHRSLLDQPSYGIAKQ